jgi:hypothetical protein
VEVRLQLRSVKESSMSELEARSSALIVACGYEHRSQGVSTRLHSLPSSCHALCFREHSTEIARKENEEFFRNRGFQLHNVGSDESPLVQRITSEALASAIAEGRGVAFDISTMTRSWHGAIIRQLRLETYESELETFFAYAPSEFIAPRSASIPNEIVSPVTGFASLSTPDMPVAVIIGLGYEKDSALGLQQLLDPAMTILLVPNSGEGDMYYPLVIKHNREVLQRTPSEWIFEYSISEPASTFAMLASMVGGIRQSYRIVLASLGPKIFGLLCFLLASRFSDVSVWRISSGVHSRPRDSHADLDRLVVLDVIWEP